MTPYQSGVHPKGLRGVVFTFFIIILGVTSGLGADTPNLASFEALTQSGFEHYYSLEYDQAVKDFQKALELSPDDPRAYNHLLEALLFRELYRHDALDTSLYLQEGFLNSKQITLEPAVRQQIKELTDKANSLSEKRLNSNPQDIQALYARGVTRGLRSTYMALVEHSWFSALRNALGSRSDHEAVLTLQPSFTDAKTVVGIHNYVGQ